MPGRLRQSGVRSPEVTKHTKVYNIPGLEFDEALTWRAGKAIAVADLLSRLQSLATELRSLEQGQIAAKEFTKLAQDLSHSNLLGHKDKGIRACTLCCIVDILNICAPDAPFNPGQLKDIFTVVVNTILPALADPSNAYNAQHVYIMNSLVDTKSIVLITDLPNSESLIIPLFTICFDIVSGVGHNAAGIEMAKSVEFQLRSMMVTIIDEVNLPQEVTDIILSQFLRVDPKTTVDPATKKRQEKDKKQETLTLKDYPPAYNMAKSICTSCPDKMTVHVTQYFGNIIMNASATLDDNNNIRQTVRKHTEIDDSDTEDESLADLRKAHRLVKELWRACPDLLLNVIPQIESELAADSVPLRQLATETLGDIIAGIGISGLPPSSALDPSAYPLPSIEEPEPAPSTTNPILLPASPKPFGSVHGTTFQAFLGRRMDKSPMVRSAWVTAISRILLTDAGGIGISIEDRDKLLAGYAQMLQDMDDKVRGTAIETMASFDYHRLVKVLGADYGLAVPGTVLSNLAERVSDRKPNVRELAMLTLGRVWGVASRDICNGNETATAILGPIPSRLFNAMYVNDMTTHLLVDRVLYETLLPLGFPPTKSKGESQGRRGKTSQSQDLSASDADHVRARRMLALVKGLDTRAKQIFLRIQKRQAEMTRAMALFLKACEDFNGGVVEDSDEEKRLKDTLARLNQGLARQFPDVAKASLDLSKFSKMHDRRNYQLIRFAMSPEYDYRTMTKAIKELIKRIREGPSNSQSLSETLLPLLYRCALIVYNRSHIPAIMEVSRSDEDGNAEIAHEILKDVSAVNPEVLKSHIQALCKELQDSAPSETSAESPSAADTLKACAGFARKYPAEVPKDRKFLTALIEYAINSHTYRAAKHAVTILLTVSDKRELHAKELIVKAIKNCEPGSPQYLSRLATIAQVCLLAPDAAAAEESAIDIIALDHCLYMNRFPDKRNDLNAWEVPPNDETIAKQLSLKIIVNRCRSTSQKEKPQSSDQTAQKVLETLTRIVQQDGEISSTEDTAPAQRNYLRLTAARFIIKLCGEGQRLEELVTPDMFKTVALIVINPPNPVRNGFVSQLRKYLSRGVLHQRWLTVLFLLAFEPDAKLKSDTVSWLKSRVQYYNRQQNQTSGAKASAQTTMESAFARLLSLLAHHPDYPDQSLESFDSELLDFAKYIIFYLQAVATEENLSLIFHIAQRVKQTQDNVTGTHDMSTRIYVLSDLAQAIVRNYADLMPAHARGVNLLQTYPGRVTLPNTLFSALPSTAKAHEIAAKNFLPEEVAVNLERLIRSVVRAGKGDKPRRPAADKKRKSNVSIDLDNDKMVDGHGSAKKSKKTSLPIRRTPTSKRINETSLSSEQPSRKSARVSSTAAVNYAEEDEEEEEPRDKAVVQQSSPIERVVRSMHRAKRRASSPTPDQLENDQDDANGGTDADEIRKDDDDDVMDGDEPPEIETRQIEASERADSLSEVDSTTSGKRPPRRKAASAKAATKITKTIKLDNHKSKTKEVASSSSVNTTPGARRSTRNTKA